MEKNRREIAAKKAHDSAAKSTKFQSSVSLETTSKYGGITEPPTKKVKSSKYEESNTIERLKSPIRIVARALHICSEEAGALGHQTAPPSKSVSLPPPIKDKVKETIDLSVELQDAELEELVRIVSFILLCHLNF